MKDDIVDEEYRKVVGVYLGLWLSRIASFTASVCIWATTSEIIKNPFGRQAIPMNWDYPEVNPLSNSSGSASTQISYLLDVVIHESNINGKYPSHVQFGDAGCLKLNDLNTTVITDPPYFDAIAYANLSDFFYVWLKMAFNKVNMEGLLTPLTPKSDEATALKHHHSGSAEEADKHFKKKLAQAFAVSHRLTAPEGVIAIMFAHQTTKAWTALIHAIFDAGLTIDATWPIDTELTTALKRNMSALSSSITVICRSRTIGSAASFNEVRKEVENVVEESVRCFWAYGFRGADLIVACYGPAVGVFGKYERVEKADGTPVEIPELLDLARIAARDAIAGEFRGDNFSTLYYVWANLYGVSEQAWDDARLVVQIGGSTGFQPVEKGRRQDACAPTDPMEVARKQGIFILDGAKCRLALLADRAERKSLGIDQSPPLIDALHRAMLYWKEEKRTELISYLAERDLLENLSDGQAGGPFWKLTQALFEVLPRDTEDWKLANALLGERHVLRTEAKRSRAHQAQKTLFAL